MTHIFQWDISPDDNLATQLPRAGYQASIPDLVIVAAHEPAAVMAATIARPRRIIDNRSIAPSNRYWTSSADEGIGPPSRTP